MIESLGIEYSGIKIITDIDDCLMKTTEAISRANIGKAIFWKFKAVYDANKQAVFGDAELTEWGVEFIDMIRSGTLIDYELITSAHDRAEIICSKFGIESSKIKEAMPDRAKVMMLNGLDCPAIYVDDKSQVISMISNPLVLAVNYPKSGRVSITSTYPKGLSKGRRF